MKSEQSSNLKNVASVEPTSQTSQDEEFSSIFKEDIMEKVQNFSKLNLIEVWNIIIFSIF